jgi:hypothetical protein
VLPGSFAAVTGARQAPVTGKEAAGLMQSAGGRSDEAEFVFDISWPNAPSARPLGA